MRRYDAVYRMHEPSERSQHRHQIFHLYYYWQQAVLTTVQHVHRITSQYIVLTVTMYKPGKPYHHNMFDISSLQSSCHANT
eukprot:217282-Chlamydomonas_euryale.AAC.5